MKPKHSTDCNFFIFKNKIFCLLKIRWLIFCFLFICAPFAFSQNIFLGGQFTLAIFENELSDFMISPELGYKINKIDVGISPSYSYNGRLSDLGIGIFAGYSFWEIEKLSILGRFDFNYFLEGLSSKNNEYFNQRIELKISPVFEYRLLDNLSVYSHIGDFIYDYRWTNNPYASNWGGSNFLFLLSSNFSLGFYIWL